MSGPGTGRGQIGHRVYDLESICFRGQVMLDDGSIARDASVSCACRGASPVASVFTQPDGRFSACVQRPKGWTAFTGCTCAVALKGYRRVEVNAGNATTTEQPSVGTIVLFRLAASKEATVSAPSLAVPNNARKAYEKGAAAIRKRDWKAAERDLGKAVKLYPGYAEAWHELGLAYRAQRRPEDARRAFEQAISADAKYLPPQLALAAFFFERQQWKELAGVTERVLALDRTGYPLAYLHHAIANLNLGDLEAAEKSARLALQLDKNRQLPAVQLALGLILAQKGDYSGAIEYFRAYLEQAPDAPDAEVVRTHLKNAERLRRE